ncbi:MAG: hypothetical protein PXY39_02895 [archaeon]|nr:hypothetical protein [archaeon]
MAEEKDEYKVVLERRAETMVVTARPGLSFLLDDDDTKFSFDLDDSLSN